MQQISPHLSITNSSSQHCHQRGAYVHHDDVMKYYETPMYEHINGHKSQFVTMPHNNCNAKISRDTSLSERK